MALTTVSLADPVHLSIGGHVAEPVQVGTTVAVERRGASSGRLSRCSQSFRSSLPSGKFSLPMLEPESTLPSSPTHVDLNLIGSESRPVHQT